MTSEPTERRVVGECEICGCDVFNDDKVKRNRTTNAPAHVACIERRNRMIDPGAVCTMCKEEIGNARFLRSRSAPYEPDRFVHESCWHKCPICGEQIVIPIDEKTGGTVDPDTNRPMHIGECFDEYRRRIEQREKERAEKRERERLEYLRERFDRDVAARLSKLPDFHPCFSTPEFEAAVKNPLLRKLVKYTGDRNCKISGPSGAGKTVTAKAIVQNLVPANPELRSIFVTEKQFDWERDESLNTKRYSLELLESFMWTTGFELANARRYSPLGSEPQLIVEAKRASFLVIDDIGSEPLADNIVLEVLDARMGRSTSTLVTTGLDTDAFIARYGSAVNRRLTETGIGIDVSAWPKKAAALSMVKS